MFMVFFSNGHTEETFETVSAAFRYGLIISRQFHIRAKSDNRIVAQYNFYGM